MVVLRQSCRRSKIAKDERADDCAEKAVPSDFHVFIIGKVLVLWVRCHAFLTYRLVYRGFFFSSTITKKEKTNKQTNGLTSLPLWTIFITVSYNGDQ